MLARKCGGIDLVQAQHQFAAALLDPAAPVPAAICRDDGRAPERRFSVHRNNVIASLVSALATRFPVVHRLVGDEFFRAMARVYAMKEPPRSPLLLAYGGTFPDFIANFPPAASIEYLADVARLEFARGRAYHAADAAPLDSATLRFLPPDQILGLSIALHPSVFLVASRFPIVSIWEAHQDVEVVPVREWVPEVALVARPGLEVEMWRLPPSGHTFLRSLAEGKTLTLAAETAAADAADFDLVASLAVLFQANVAVGIRS